MLISDLKDDNNLRKIHRNKDNPEKLFFQNHVKPLEKTIFGFTFLSGALFLILSLQI
jgi:hypothetical protein